MTETTKSLEELEREKAQWREVLPNFDGPRGGSIFSTTYGGRYTTLEDSERVQKELNELLAYDKSGRDERLLALYGALLVEQGVDRLLGALMPGYKKLQDSSSFTFSVAIAVAKALRLIPTRMLSNADLVRQIRNKFVHDLSLDTFAALDEKYIRRARARVSACNLNVPEEDAAVFAALAYWTTEALYRYAVHVEYMNEFIRGDKFLPKLEDYHGVPKYYYPPPTSVSSADVG